MNAMHTMRMGLLFCAVRQSAGHAGSCRKGRPRQAGQSRSRHRHPRRHQEDQRLFRQCHDQPGHPDGACRPRAGDAECQRTRHGSAQRGARWHFARSWMAARNISKASPTASSLTASAANSNSSARPVCSGGRRIARRADFLQRQYRVLHGHRPAQRANPWRPRARRHPPETAAADTARRQTMSQISPRA